MIRVEKSTHLRIRRLSAADLKQLALGIEQAVFDEQITKARAGVKEYQHRVTQLFTCLGDSDNHVLSLLYTQYCTLYRWP